MKHSELRHQPRHVNPRIQVIPQTIWANHSLTSLVRGVRGTWNFLIYLATQAQGCACEVHLSMDANMHRLQEEKYVVEILSAPFSPYVVLMRNELPR